MEVIQLRPAFKDYLWGGHRLVEEYDKKADCDPVAESWELSAHKDGSSIIVGGAYDGMLFKDYIDQHSKDLWGTKAEKDTTFPILIKFIDAKQPLSIQVHPDDTYAWEHEHEPGKNEFWYVMEADPDSFLYYGVKEPMTKEEYRAHIQDDTICDYLNRVHVKKGDCFFIQAGTIHAIGAGLMIAEIQQSSNSTYRVYDFGRVGKDGKPRQLHIDKAVDVSRLTPSGKNGEADGPLMQKNGYTEQVLTNNKYFTCTKYHVITAYTETVTTQSFQGLTILDGEGTLAYDNEVLPLRKGDSVFIPAQDGKYEMNGNLTWIQTVL